jgi:uncharacterized membrane protein
MTGIAIEAAWPPMLAAFLASLVEFVEALTVVLAVGMVRGWRSALTGTGLAFAVLVALVVVLGPALTRIPLNLVQLVVGTLLLLFGMRWLRKAILRARRVRQARAGSETAEQPHCTRSRLRVTTSRAHQVAVAAGSPRKADPLPSEVPVDVALATVR